jgi:hypothetical protein
MANNEMKALRFGIEIEVVGADRAQLAQAATARRADRRPVGWSSRAAVEHRPRRLAVEQRAGEVVSPILTWEDIGSCPGGRAQPARDRRARRQQLRHPIHVDGATSTEGVKNL